MERRHEGELGFANGEQVQVWRRKGEVSCVRGEIDCFFLLSFGFLTHLRGILTGDRQLRCRVADAGTFKVEAAVVPV